MNNQILSEYKKNLSETLEDININHVESVVECFFQNWKNGKNIFICGNGGSAGNANHIANDFLYGVSEKNTRGMKIESLSSNSSVITCLANDISYEDIYSEQLNSKASKDDLLVILSGSGNSQNILKAIKKAKELKLKTIGILGFDGGLAKNEVDIPIHFNLDDMQVCEDLQLSFLHICMKILINKNISS
jgi:D-sedoheptulose 7-phosphate isomerase